MENYLTKEVNDSSVDPGMKVAQSNNRRERKTKINETLVIQDRGSQHLMSIDWTKPISMTDEAAIHQNKQDINQMNEPIDRNLIAKTEQQTIQHQKLN